MPPILSERYRTQQALLELLRGLSGAGPGVARLHRLLQLYWDLSLRGGVSLGEALLPLLQRELQQLGCSGVALLAADTARCASDIALHEARSGRPAETRREGLLHCLLDSALE